MVHTAFINLEINFVTMDVWFTPRFPLVKRTTSFDGKEEIPLFRRVKYCYFLMHQTFRFGLLKGKQIYIILLGGP